MWPWGHLAVGYLVYTTFTHVWYHRPPEERATVALAVATQLPDIIDKPLSWTLHLLPHGRSLAHSLFTATFLIVAFRFILGRHRLPIWRAFSIGYISHLFADTIEPILAGEYTALRFLVWPVIPAIEYESYPSFTGHLFSIELSSYVVVQFGFAALLLWVWVYDSKPGLTTALQFPRLAYQKLVIDRKTDR